MDPTAATVYLAIIAIVGQVATILLQWITRTKVNDAVVKVEATAHAVDQVHSVTNSRLAAALAELEKLRAERAEEQKAAAVKDATTAAIAATIVSGATIPKGPANA